ncbi:MAG: prepilin-type N-terminal cleavage/methylation domain-containing protein [Gammaproteobacteria bacterium]|nr:prepilin-type N-terminal cleavage/methylation domain-containing protein [Gammaproteobacteria bacterium]
MMRHRYKIINDRALQGFTLIEMIVVIVVITAVAGTMLGVFQKAVIASADPVLRVQGVAIAQGYLEEALLKDFQDPDGGETASCEEASRDLYDDVQDYNCINDTSGARDQLGNALAGLSNFNVRVTVSSASLGSGANAAALQQVNVLVTHDVYPITLRISGYRGNY